jgi:hypothetical protein
MEHKFPSKKGRTALEYMMTYGWMLVIIGIVGVALWQMGFFRSKDDSFWKHRFLAGETSGLESFSLRQDSHAYSD